MIDIVEVTDDLGVFDSNVPKAENVLKVQLGTLDYLPNFGIDLAFFLSEDFEFQNEAFRAYLLQRLTESSIDVASVVTTVESLYSQYVFNLSATDTSNNSLMR